MQHLFKRYLRFAARSWNRETSLRTSTFLILVFTYAITIFLVESAINFKSIVNRWGDEAKINVYLSEGQTESSLQTISRQLSSYKEVENLKYISRDNAMIDFSANNTLFSKAFINDLKNQSVFTDSYEVKLKGSLQNENYLSVMGSLSAKIKNIIGVDEVSYGQGWVERYSAFLKFSNSLIFIIVSLFVIATLLMISNLIRVLIYNHKEEIEILELIGETARNIRFPFVCEGIIFSAFAFTIGLIVNIGVFHWIHTELSSSSLLSHLKEVIAKPSIGFVVTGLLLSMLFGALSSYLTSRSINTGWAFSKRNN